MIWNGVGKHTSLRSENFLQRHEKVFDAIILLCDLYHGIRTDNQQSYAAIRLF
jgi:hypothetical protein